MEDNIITFDKEQIENIFDTFDNQADVIVELYKLAFRDDWDNIKMLKGFPKCGKELSDIIWKKFIKFDQKYHPNCINGGLWLDSGFSTDESLGDWEVELCEYESV